MSALISFVRMPIKGFEMEIISLLGKLETKRGGTGPMLGMKKKLGLWCCILQLEETSCVGSIHSWRRSRRKHGGSPPCACFGLYGWKEIGGCLMMSSSRTKL